MNKIATPYRERHQVKLFEHVDNTALNDDFFLAVEQFKDEIMALIRIRPHHGRDITRESLDQLSLIDLVKLPEAKLSMRSLKFPALVPSTGRNLALDQYLIAPIIYNELNHIRACNENGLNDVLQFVQLSALDKVFGKMGIDKYIHDSRNEFFTCYINSFIQDERLRLKYALEASISMSYGNEDHWPFSYFSESTLGSLRYATLLNAAQHVGINASEKLKTSLKMFPDARIRNFLEHDFLGGNFQKYSEKLQVAMEWITEKGSDDQLKDWIIGDWLSHQCAIYYAHHLQEDLLKDFINIMIESMSDALEYEQPVLEAIKEALFKQSILITPKRFVENGYTKSDFLRPLSLDSKKLGKALSSTNGVYTKSKGKDYSWLTLPSIVQIKEQCGFEISADDIIKHAIGKDFQIALLHELKPSDYIDSFVNGMNDKSNEHLYTIAKQLIGIYSDSHNVQKIQNAYLLKMAFRNKDKPLNPKKYGLDWIDKSKSVEALREAGLLGNYSVISLLELSGHDLLNDMPSLSAVSKRMTLSSDLEV
jgi:hypothetical protein